MKASAESPPHCLSVVCMCRGGSVKGQNELWGWSSGGILSATKVCDLLVPRTHSSPADLGPVAGVSHQLGLLTAQLGREAVQAGSWGLCSPEGLGPRWVWWKRPSVPRLVGGPQGPRASAGLPRVSRKRQEEQVSRGRSLGISVWSQKRQSVTSVIFRLFKKLPVRSTRKGRGLLESVRWGPWEEI